MKVGAEAPSLNVEVITPELAAEILAGGRRNRALRMNRVVQLAESMKRGEWELNGETVKFDADGCLIDGEVRLHAIVHSGCEVEILVVRGLPADAQNSIDVGRKRRLADILKIEGYVDTHALAATVNMLYRYRNGIRLDYAQKTAPSVKQALQLIESEPDIGKSVTVARHVTRSIGGPIGIFGALHREFTMIDPEPTAAFFDGLETGQDLNKGDPLFSLRRQMTRPRTDRRYILTPSAVAGLTVKAFNLRRQGAKVTVLSYKVNERMPTVATRSAPADREIETATPLR